MKTWQFALVGLVLSATAGCRTNPAIPILERQLRLQEDEIYRLRATIEDLRECPSPSEDRPAKSTKSTTAAERESDRPRRKAGAAEPNGATPPKVEMSLPPSSKAPDTLKIPPSSLPPNVPEVPKNLQRPSESTGPNLDGPSLERATGGGSSWPGNATMASRSASAVPFTPSGDSRRVAGIALNRTLTGGINAGDRSGDQGLLVVLEPRDRAGRTVDAPAEISIVVLDPGLKDEEGKAARVARWDFSAAETTAMFRRTGATGAIHLMMTWPEDPPKHSKLHLFVRYVTADGRKLEANQPIEVALAGVPGPSPHTATRSDASQPARPVWSPERR